MDRRLLTRVGAALGGVAVIGNVIGVVALRHVPAAYRPGDMAAWVDEVIARPGDVAISATAFTLGLIALAGWALVLGGWLDTVGSRVAGAAIAVGAIIDSAGTPAPYVLAALVAPMCAAAADCHAIGAALLGLSLSFDALFNLLLGASLLTMAPPLWHRDGSWRWVALLAAAAGVASLPVSLQIRYDWAAGWLAVAGPLWLGVIVWTSVRLWVERP